MKRQELIDFAYWVIENIKSNDIVPWKVDEYLKLINSTQSKSVICTKCKWKGEESNLADNNTCPGCGSYAIEYDIT